MSNRSRARLTPHQRKGRSGKANDEARARMFARMGDRCWICGHRGASDSDHVVSLATGGDPLALHNRRPAHGRVPCYQCPPNPRTGRPRRCNQEKGSGAKQGRGMGNKRASVRLNTSEEW